MKKILSIIMTNVIVLMMFASVSSVGAKSEEYFDKTSKTYYTISKGSAVAVGYKGELKYWKIPAKLGGNSVVAVNCSKYLSESTKKVKIPASVKTIGNKLILSANMYGTKFVVNNGSAAQKAARKNRIIYYSLEDKQWYGALYNAVNVYDSKGNKLSKDGGFYSLPNYYCTGKAVKPSFKIKLKKTGKELKKNVDYKVQYCNNVSVGEAVVLVKPINNYFAEGINLYYKILPEKLKNVTLEKVFTDSEAENMSSGYVFPTGNYYDTPSMFEMKYSLNKDFSNSKTLKSKYKSDLQIWDYYGKNRYYVKIRAIVNCCALKRTLGKCAMDYSKTYTLTGKWSNTATGIPFELKDYGD